MLTLGPVEAEAPLRFGQQKQLLVDNEALCNWWKVRRVQERVRKHPGNPIVECAQAWEEEARNTYGTWPCTALYDAEDRLYKLWYGLRDFQGKAMAYATSTDGVNWTKPDLGLVEYCGTTHNNVCRLEPAGKPLYGYSMCVIKNTPQDVPERRFKAMSVTPYHEDGTTYGNWSAAAFSADGTTWHQMGGGVHEGGNGLNCVWDERLGRYVMFIMPPTGRTWYISRRESQDLVNWSPEQTVFNPHMDTKLPEVEEMMVFRHEGIYFGLPQTVATSEETTGTGETEVHLATSRDGYRWQQPFPYEAFIPLGPRGDFDDTMTWFAQAVIHGDEIRFYYGGTTYPDSQPHRPIVDDGTSLDPWKPGSRPGKIGLATVPLDRLLGLRADEPVGHFTTRPFVVEGTELYVNAIVDRELRVEILDPHVVMKDRGRKAHMGHYISAREQRHPGFERDKCPAVTGDSLRHRVRWQGGSIGKFKGQAIRLRFLARAATVYSFQVCEA